MKITTISPAGIDCIAQSEGLRLHAYQDGGGIWTIGYGTTRYLDGHRVKAGDVCTEAQAREWLMHDVAGACANVSRLITADISQHQFDALVSFCYNVGAGSFAASSVRKLVNLDPHNPEIRRAFMLWVNIKGKPSEGLKNRRKREADLYFS